MKPFDRTSLAIAAGTLCLLTLFFWRTPLPKQPVHYACLATDRPDVTVDGFTLQSVAQASQSGWKLAAQRADIFQETGAITCTDITYCMLRDGQQVGLLLSQRGKVDQTKNTAWLYGSVSGSYGEMKLYGSDFFGDLEHMRVDSDQPVRVEHDSFVIDADSIVLAFGEETVTFRGKVRSTFMH